MNINEYVKIYGEKNPVKLHTPEVIEAFHAHFLPKLYFMEANMSMRVYLMKKTNVTTAKLI